MSSAEIERRQVINELHRLVAQVRKDMALLAGNPPVSKFQVAANQSIENHRMYFNANRHWLPLDLCAELQQLSGFFHDAFVDFTIQGHEGRGEAILRAWHLLNEDATELQQQIEKGFRELLATNVSAGAPKRGHESVWKFLFGGLGAGVVVLGLGYLLNGWDPLGLFADRGKALDLDRYCTVVLGGVDADHDGSRWQCEMEDETRRDFDAEKVCAWQFNGARPRAERINDSPHGWRCFE